MRLSDRVKNKIKKGILQSFGDVDIYLLGSRADDAKKGGDIDIAVDVEMSRDVFKQCKVKFLKSLMEQGLDLKIDIVPYRSQDDLLNAEISKTALKI